jgi:transposase-like protein
MQRRIRVFTVECQKFCKLLDALRVIVFHPFSSTQHNNMAPTIERSRPARSRARGRNLTPFERGRIVQAYEDGYTLESIADQFQRAPSTIFRTIHGVSQHNEGSERPRTGRPRTFTPREQRRLENAVKKYTLSGRTKRSRVYTAFHGVSRLCDECSSYLVFKSGLRRSALFRQKRQLLRDTNGPKNTVNGLLPSGPMSYVLTSVLWSVGLLIWVNTSSALLANSSIATKLPTITRARICVL